VVDVRQMRPRASPPIRMEGSAALSPRQLYTTLVGTSVLLLQILYATVFRRKGNR